MRTILDLRPGAPSLPIPFSQADRILAASHISLPPLPPAQPDNDGIEPLHEPQSASDPQRVPAGVPHAPPDLHSSSHSCGAIRACVPFSTRRSSAACYCYGCLYSTGLPRLDVLASRDRFIPINLQPEPPPPLPLFDRQLALPLAWVGVFHSCFAFYLALVRITLTFR